ncbi:tetratricopeptide repeat protein [Fulvivirga sp. RKSG066]|uniref:tetratricopeptide repeat protein n=1 Tax=Fulvivirga aurantia TaxID=2529383 RepID=UPI0012BC5479|nr:tetratricopeptide repeat protein [Fulvivirga aurantia]MTI23040.1 tetratricopeptide repeat protein [Fulvivirga aurantia]
MVRVFIALLLTISTHCLAQQTTQIELLVKAERTLAEGDTAQSIDQFKEVLQRFPQSYAAITRLAEIHFAKKEFDQSTQYIYLGIDIVEQFLDKQEVKINQQKGEVSGLSKNKANDIRHRYMTDLASLYHLLGLNRNRQGRFNDAIEAFQKSLTLDEKSATHIDLALASLNADKNMEALDALHDAIAIDNASFKAFYNLANIYNQFENYDSAIHYYEKTISLNDSLKWPYLYLARLYTQEETINKALQNLDMFIAIDSMKVEPFYRRAILLTGQNRFQMAIEDWNKVIALDPQNHEAFRNRGLTYFYLENFEKALEDFNQSLNLNKGEPFTLINRGYSYYLLDQSDEALVDLNQGVTLLPKYALGYYIRSLTYLSLKKKKKACEDLKKALELGFNESEIDKKLLRKCL